MSDVNDSTPNDPKIDKSSITRICRKCKQLTQYDDLVRTDSGRDGVDHLCRTCNSKYLLEYRTKNAEKVKQGRQQWYRDNKDYVIQQHKWYTNQEHIKEKERERNKRRYHKNPLPTLVRKHRRRARRKQVAATFTPQNWRDCLAYWDHKCAYCGRPRGLWHSMAEEHFVPLAKGGSYTADNIVPACHGIDGCNNSKHIRDVKAWLIEKFGKRKANAILRDIEAYFVWVRSSAQQLPLDGLDSE